MYKVIKAFGDLQDFKKTKDGTIYHTYEVDDEYPRQGYAPSTERIEELASCSNLQGTPLIEEVEEPKKNSKMSKKGK